MPEPILLATSQSPAEEAIWRDALARAMPGERIVTAADEFDRSTVAIAIVANPVPGALAGLPSLAWVHSLWAGVDRLLQDATLPPVPVVRLVDPTLARTMAETVAACVLALHRDLPLYAAQQRRREWRQHPARAAGACPVAILGMGEMGRASVELLLGLGFPVRGWSRSGTAIPGLIAHSGRDGLGRALDGAAYLVNLLPLTAETRGILDRACFARLAPSAGVINFGRGAHLVEADLWQALDDGRVGHAVLDVFAQEPLPRDHPAWDHPNVTVLPHVAAPTDEASAAAIVAGAVAAFRSTGRVPAGVDRARGY
ncbi:glyoxylate/hydroxypyruvate reductase A [Methylobacterium sp. E-025]|uniref:2-hydroxyacid dehydrogenase n=1 Tax=Methylobacterium sp. E-025 TaxID=2836561 RepID=UPI001FBB5C48|nr:glyoxylate/hydroxypyruvate reductase A [Methylobacterium sp. E-025]MCJ2109845.1 glyoxylate/hydroxypyruvate reductase A [Methylobacterium sp. E-025]